MPYLPKQHINSSISNDGDNSRRRQSNSILALACMLGCFRCVQLFVTRWTIAPQAPLSMGPSRQQYWSGLPCPPPGDLPNPRIKPLLLCLLHWQAGSSDINHSKIVYDTPPRVMEIKTKINKWGLIKLKSFFTTKKTISKVKRQPSEWEKIVANEATDKELISKIQATHAAQYLKNKRPNTKIGQKIKQTFLQRRHTDG